MVGLKVNDSCLYFKELLWWGGRCGLHMQLWVYSRTAHEIGSELCQLSFIFNTLPL